METGPCEGRVVDVRGDRDAAVPRHVCPKAVALQDVHEDPDRLRRPVRREVRTRNAFSATSVDQLPAQMLAYLMYGHQLLLPVPDPDSTQHFLVFGANPMASNGSLLTVPDFPARLRAPKARGGRMVVVDPRRTETAKAAREHHFVRPGSDAFRAAGDAARAVRRDLLTPPGVGRRARHGARGRAALHPRACRRGERHRGGRRTTPGA